MQKRFLTLVLAALFASSLHTHSSFLDDWDMRCTGTKKLLIGTVVLLVLSQFTSFIYFLKRGRLIDKQGQLIKELQNSMNDEVNNRIQTLEVKMNYLGIVLDEEKEEFVLQDGSCLKEIDTGIGYLLTVFLCMGHQLGMLNENEEFNLGDYLDKDENLNLEDYSGNTFVQRFNNLDELIKSLQKDINSFVISDEITNQLNGLVNSVEELNKLSSNYDNGNNFTKEFETLEESINLLNQVIGNMKKGLGFNENFESDFKFNSYEDLSKMYGDVARLQNYNTQLDRNFTYLKHGNDLQTKLGYLENRVVELESYVESSSEEISSDTEL